VQKLHLQHMKEMNDDLCAELGIQAKVPAMQ
jgi:hypothetical protein